MPATHDPELDLQCDLMQAYMTLQGILSMRVPTVQTRQGEHLQAPSTRLGIAYDLLYCKLPHILHQLRRDTRLHAHTARAHPILLKTEIARVSLEIKQLQQHLAFHCQLPQILQQLLHATCQHNTAAEVERAHRSLLDTEIARVKLEISQLQQRAGLLPSSSSNTSC
jgi:hypothetical protein